MKNILDRVNNKNILILGFGAEGKSTLNFLKKYAENINITVADKTTLELPDGISGIFGDNYQKYIDNFDLVIKSPGIVLESYVDTSNITSQTELFLHEYSAQTIGITGTKGKSTSTTLLYHILNQVLGNCVLLGNIGIPAFDVIPEIKPDTTCVFELSAHQLEYTRVSPETAVILNLHPEHLDHYGTYEKYVHAKENIFRYQSPDNCFFCGNDEKLQINACPSKVTTVSATNETADVFVRGREIVFGNHSVTINPDDTLLVGAHNLFNIALVYAICKTKDISDADFKAALKTYRPLPHRLEFFAEIDGVKYYDDSISTIGTTTIGALKSFDNVGSVIIGGMDRGIDYSDLTDFLQDYDVDNIILIPDTGKRIAEALKGKTNIIMADSLEHAASIAKDKTPKGKLCILSPAAASYGFFKNFEERGDAFKKFILSGT